MLGSATFKLCAAAAAVVMQTSVVCATISFDVGFDNTTPLTEAAQAGIKATKPTQFSAGPAVTGTVVSGFPSGETTNKVLLLTASSVAGSNARADLYFKAADSDAAASGKFKITMDIYFAPLDDGSLNRFFYVNLRDAGGTAFGGFGINYGSSAGYLNTGGVGSNPAMNSLVSRNALHTLELLVDLDANTQTLTMDGSIAMGSSAIKDGVNFQQLTINTDTTAQGKLYIDNVKITPVPEPTALGLLGAGALATLSLTKSKSGR